MTKDLNYQENFNREAGPLPNSAVMPLIESEFASHLEPLGLSEKEQSQLLQALWNIMRGFVDLGFDVHAVGAVFPEIFEKNPETDTNSVEEPGNLLSNKFQEAAKPVRED